MKTEYTLADIKSEADNYIECAKKRAATVRKCSKKLAATLEFLNRRIALIDDTNAAISAWHQYDAYAGTVGIQAEIQVTADSLIEGVVPQCLKAMIDIECEPISSADVTTSYSASRTYCFERAESEHFSEIAIRVVVNIEESLFGTCKKVQIGTKMVEVPEYRIECIEPVQAQGETA